MAWIESHQQMKDHPKTKRLAKLLGISIPTAIGHMHCLWYWALEYAQDGNLTDFTPDEIAEAALWGGSAQAFVDALIGCGVGGGAGFLDGDPLRVHDWYDYAGKLLE